MTTVLANARLVLPDEVITGAVKIDGGTITSIDPGTAVPNGAEDCEGAYLSPGLVELHTDNLERHMQPRPGVRWPLDAAILAHDRELAGAGVTTVFDALRIGSIVSDQKSRYGKYARPVATKIRQQRDSGALAISHFLHLRAETCSETLPEELAEFGPDDRIGIVSLMDHTPGQRQFRDVAKLEEYLIGKYNMSRTDMDNHFARRKALSDRVRDDFTKAAIEAGHRMGATLASHDDTLIEDVQGSQQAGCRIAEFPTTLEAATASHAAGIAVVMGAPNYLRGGSHSGNVSAKDCAEAGVLDILSSDYVPASLLLAAVKLGLDYGNLSKGMRTVTEAPAAAAGLHDRGRIEIGQRADLIRFSIADDLPMIKGAWSRGRRI